MNIVELQRAQDAFTDALQRFRQAEADREAYLHDRAAQRHAEIVDEAMRDPEELDRIVMKFFVQTELLMVRLAGELMSMSRAQYELLHRVQRGDDRESLLEVQAAISKALRNCLAGDADIYAYALQQVAEEGI